MTSGRSLVDDGPFVRSGVGRQEMERKIEQRIEAGTEQATALLDRLATDEISDAIVQIGPGANGRGGRIALVGDDVGFEFGGRVRTFHPHAAVQFGEKLGLPGTWLRNTIVGKPWQRAMVADVMATTLQHTEERDRILVRSVGDTVRGILSDQYRRLSSPDLATAFRTAIGQVGAVPVQAKSNDLRWDITALLPYVIPIVLPNHGEQFIAAGVRFGNSDFGAGATDLAFFWERLWCANGATRESIMRQIHKGARLPDNITLSERTYRLDTETTASMVQDLITGLLTNDSIKAQLGPIINASATVVEVKDETDKLVKANRLSKAEVETLNAALTRNDPSEVPEGPATRFKLSQAVSWLAHSAGSIDRKNELEALAGQLVLAGSN